jgi:hypothetical protein
MRLRHNYSDSEQSQFQSPRQILRYRRRHYNRRRRRRLYLQFRKLESSL